MRPNEELPTSDLEKAGRRYEIIRPLLEPGERRPRRKEIAECEGVPEHHLEIWETQYRRHNCLAALLADPVDSIQDEDHQDGRSRAIGADFGRPAGRFVVVPRPGAEKAESGPESPGAATKRRAKGRNGSRSGPDPDPDPAGIVSKSRTKRDEIASRSRTKRDENVSDPSPGRASGSRVPLGKVDGKPFGVDLPQLLQTRLLVQGASGSGKTSTLRALMVASHHRVQQLVIDTEGDLSPLADEYPYLRCDSEAGGLAPRPGTAGVLAAELYRRRHSAIINVEDLGLYDRRVFVSDFMRALLASPPEDWHPAMVIVDESQIYCPQRSEVKTSELPSRHAIVDMACRGRKRGLCLVLATHRLAKLYKDAASELLNVMVGTTALDADLKRCAEDLGMTLREARRTLPELEQGEFVGFGPALSTNPLRIRVDYVPIERGEVDFDAEPVPAGKKDVADLAEVLGAAAPSDPEEAEGNEEEPEGGETPAEYRFRVIEPLLAEQIPTIRAVREQADEFGESAADVFGWLIRYRRSSGDVEALTPGQKIKGPMNRDNQRALFRAIVAVLGDGSPESLQDVVNQVGDRLREAGFPAASYPTVRNYFGWFANEKPFREWLRALKRAG